jgi:hypothetical protein
MVKEVLDTSIIIPSYTDNSRIGGICQMEKSPREELWFVSAEIILCPVVP